MTRAKDAVGAYGERVAVRYLLDQGMVLLDRNWRCGTGELDAVLRDGEAVVFAEVKTRRGGRFGTPAGARLPAKGQRPPPPPAPLVPPFPDHPRAGRLSRCSRLCPPPRGSVLV